jgi:hypothetical protein
MPNRASPCGLRPINQPYGAIRCNWYQAATGTAIYMYQPVDLDSNGRVVLTAANSFATTVGSVMGFADSNFGPLSSDYSGYLPANPPQTYVNSAGLVNVLVADDPNQYFVIMEDTGGTALANTDLNAGCALIYHGATGSTVSGVCNAVLDRSTVGTGTDLTVQLVRKWDKIDNELGNYCKWVVRIVRHRSNIQAPGGVAGSGNLV